jgi:hypothetical protein
VATRLLNARATGPFGNHSTPLDLLALAGVGLLVVRDIGPDGRCISETVVPVEDVPESWYAQYQHPMRPCFACGTDAWRPDRGTGQGWVCGRCHP